MKQLKKSDIKELNKIIEEQFGIENFFNKKDNATEDETDEYTVIKRNNESIFFYYKGKLTPTLKLLQTHSLLKKITVDMGAIKFVTKGADIMRPGITNIDSEIKENEMIVIIDETHKKPLAVGKALLDAETMQNAEKGKVIMNIHWVGDPLWVG
jgi:PUA-domain protein